MKDNKVTIHCVECDSTELTMLNATTIWDVDKQKWEYFENDDPIYQCANCGMDNDDYNKKEMKMAGIKETLDVLNAIDKLADGIKAGRVAIKGGKGIVEELKDLDAMEIKTLFIKGAETGKKLYNAVFGSI